MAETQNLLMQAVLTASIRQGKRVLQRLDGPNVPPPGAYTTNRWLLTLLHHVPTHQTDSSCSHAQGQVQPHIVIAVNVVPALVSHHRPTTVLGVATLGIGNLLAASYPMRLCFHDRSVGQPEALP